MKTIRLWEIALFIAFLATAYWFFEQFGGAPATREVVDGRYLVHPKGKETVTEVSRAVYYTYTVFEWLFVPYFFYFLIKYIDIVRASIKGER